MEIIDEKSTNFLLIILFCKNSFILPDDPYKPDWGLISNHQEWYEYARLLEKGGIVDCYLLTNEIFDRNNPDAQKNSKRFLYK